MKVIDKNIVFKKEIQKSQFITLLYYVSSIKEVDNYLKLVKNNYKNANHYCYAYIIDGYKKMSDDSEPNGTAGMPILNVLEKNNLEHILCVVVRYFGGIKLGSGGLIRAYNGSVCDSLKLCEFSKLVKGFKIKIDVPYALQKYIDNFFNVEEKSYGDNVSYIVCIKDLDKLNGLNYEIIDNIYIKEK